MVKEKAYAKINLFLDVVSKRADQYHDLESVMAPVDLHDIVTVSKRKDKEVTITSSKKITEDIKDNLVYKIAEHMINTYHLPTGIQVHIEKNIPIAAGLAGGSADAAAVLRGINKLFKLKLSLETLAEIGEMFGSDVPHCVYNKLCIARGKGEQLYFLENKLKLRVLIITPPIEVSTKKIFDAVNMAAIKNKKITGITNAIYNKNYPLILRELYNALEPITFDLFKQVERLKEEVEGYHPEGVIMTGSGPSILVFEKDKKKLKEISDKFSQKNDVFLTKIS